jgi:hypothetical protein
LIFFYWFETAAAYSAEKALYDQNNPKEKDSEGKQAKSSSSKGHEKGPKVKEVPTNYS